MRCNFTAMEVSMNDNWSAHAVNRGHRPLSAAKISVWQTSRLEELDADAVRIVQRRVVYSVSFAIGLRESQALCLEVSN